MSRRGTPGRHPTHRDGGSPGVTGSAVSPVSSGLATRPHRVGGNTPLVGAREGLAGALPLRPSLPLSGLTLTSLALTALALHPLPLAALALSGLTLAALALRPLSPTGLTLWPLALS